VDTPNSSIAESRISPREVSRCIIITGLSGGGKSATLNVFEDQGMFAIDNIPPALMPQLLELLRTHPAAVEHGVAAVMDVRGGELLHDLVEVMGRLRRMLPQTQLVFLDAEDGELLKRFETTRRRHPLGNVPILEGVAQERELLAPVREIADVVVDTSGLTLTSFREKILASVGGFHENPTVVLTSFGFKYGTPKDCDFLFDARFLPNPYYEKDLRNLSGLDQPVREFLDRIVETRVLLGHLYPLMASIIPLYGNVGKMQMHVAVGCTGGRHRSVALVEWLACHVRDLGYLCTVRHRDIDREGHY